MWIVKNELKATLSLRGLEVTIPAGQQFDLDAVGRDRAEGSNQVQVAFEEGYLANVYKAPRGAPGLGAPDSRAAAAAIAGSAVTGGISPEQLDEFKRQFLSELAERLPRGAVEASHLDQMRDAITRDVKELVGELKLIRDRFDQERGKIVQDPTLSDVEIRARLAFLEEKEQELLRNFETVGKQFSQDEGDVMGKADLLADID